MKKIIPRIVVAAVSSGSGKTTIVTGLLAHLRARGLRVQSYKIGPDYIDPGYHTLASGRPAHNLDTWLVPESQISRIFAKTSNDMDLAVIEGVMGLYDGGKRGVSSTAQIAKLLEAPVLLVIDAKSMGDSAAAIALGFRAYDPSVHLAGVILNRLGSETHRRMICEAMQQIDMPVIGALKRNEELAMPERHLGLTPTTEINAAATVACMGRAIGEQIDDDALLRIAQNAPPLTWTEETGCSRVWEKVKIAVARDEAFSFYYPESMEALEALGAEIVPFSPLNDERLPEVGGLMIGGGFPEMFVERLERNRSMRNSILAAGQAGMPIFAECGGFMYLMRRMQDFSGRGYDMTGLIPAVCRMNLKLQTVGYVTARAVRSNLLCMTEDTVQGHEFHFSSMEPDCAADSFPWAFEFTKMRTGKSYPAGYASQNILASYLHLHFAGNLKAASRFVEACRAFAAAK